MWPWTFFTIFNYLSINGDSEAHTLASVPSQAPAAAGEGRERTSSVLLWRRLAQFAAAV